MLMKREKLSATTRKRWEEYDRVACETQSSFFLHLDALHTIRNERLYREDYDTFEQYCEERFDYKMRNIHAMLEDHEHKRELIAEVSESPEEQSVIEKSSRRAIKKAASLPKEKKTGIVKAAVATVVSEGRDRITEKDIGDAAGQPQEKKPYVWKITQFGAKYEMPLHGTLRDAFEFADSAGRYCLAFRDVRDDAKKFFACEHGQLIREQHLTAAVKAVTDTIALNVPYAPCAACNLQKRNNCNACKGRLWVTKDQWGQISESVRKAFLADFEV